MQISEIKIKPLEWDEYEREGDIDEWDASDGFSGHYNIRLMTDSFLLSFSDDTKRGEEFTSLETAKAAAQSDYEQRIRNALVTPTDAGKDAIEEGAKVLASWIGYAWDGLSERDISDQFQDWTYDGIGSLKMQGGRPALRKVAAKILDRHEFQPNAPGIIGSELCTVCGKDHLPTPEASPAPVERVAGLVASLTASLNTFTKHHDPQWMEPARWATEDDSDCATFSKHTFGDLRLARKLIDEARAVLAGEDVK